MKVFVVPRLLAARITTFFRPRAVHVAPEQHSFWILHAR
jgi:hypothetical protein